MYARTHVRMYACSCARARADVNAHAHANAVCLQVFSTGTNGTDTSVVGTDSGLVYGSFITLQLGFVLMIPFALEVLIERGPRDALLKLLTTFFGLSWVFSLFAMQTKGWNFSNAITYGRASYVATGRGYQVETVSVPELYSKYAQSHIYLAFEMVFYLLIFQNVTAIVDFAQVCMMVWAAYLAAGSLALSPWVFNPQALTFPAVATGMRQWAKWMADVGDFPMAGGSYTKWHAARLRLVREASATTRCIVMFVYILVPKSVVILACFAYVRQRSTRDLRLHLLLNVLSITLLLALSYVNIGLRALVVRADALNRWLERLKEHRKLPVWLRPREAGGADERDRARPHEPHERHTSPWDMLVTAAHLARRAAWLVLSYVRFSLLFVWYYLTVLSWEQNCWSESCVACPASAAASMCTSYRTNCHIDPSTIGVGYPVWWLFAFYAWSKPASFGFGGFMDEAESRPSTASMHDLLLSCREQTRAVCARTCLEFAPAVAGDANQFVCIATEAALGCNVTLDAQGLAPINTCTAAAVAGTRMRRPSEDYVQCWAELPEMYIMGVIALLVFTVLVQWAGMVRTPAREGGQRFAPLMRAARVWADHYYRTADQLVGVSVICSLWVLTVLPLNYVQSVRLSQKHSFDLHTNVATLAWPHPHLLNVPTYLTRCCSSSAISTVSSSAARTRPTCSRSSSTEYALAPPL